METSIDISFYRKTLWNTLSKSYIKSLSKKRIKNSHGHGPKECKSYIQFHLTPLTIVEKNLTPSQEFSQFIDEDYESNLVNSSAEKEEDRLIEEVLNSHDGKSFLIIGSAGMGKSTLSINIALNWAKNYMLEGIRFLIYLDCELLHVKTAENLFSLFFTDITQNNEDTEFVAFLEQELTSNGESFIIIIDSFDVILQQHNQFHRLLTPLIARKLLPLSIIILLSRPSTHFLQHSDTLYSSYHVFEVIGFKKSNVFQYIDRYVGDQLIMLRLKSFFLCHPGFLDLLCRPLYTVIFCTYIMRDSQTIPPLDYLLKNIIVSSLNQNFVHFLDKEAKQYMIVNFNSLSANRKPTIYALLECAFISLIAGKKTVDKDIPALKNFICEGLGFFDKRCEIINGEVKQIFYFQNKILQESLACIHISMQMKVGHLYDTKAISNLLYLDKYIYFSLLLPKKKDIEDLAEDLIIQLSSRKANNDLNAVFLMINRIAERITPINYATDFIAPLFPKKLISIDDVKLTGWIFKGLTYMLRIFPHIQILRLTNCHLTDYILEALFYSIHINCELTEVNLQNNKLTDASIPTLKHLIEILPQLKQMDLSYNTLSISNLSYLENEYPNINLIRSHSIPQEILDRGREFAEEYQKALSEGYQHIKFFRLMICGAEGVGKTSLLKSLRNDPFIDNEQSTDFIEKTDINITEMNFDWGQSISFKDKLQETRDDILASWTVKRVKSQTKLNELEKIDVIEASVLADDATNSVSDINIVDSSLCDTQTIMFDSNSSKSHSILPSDEAIPSDSSSIILPKNINDNDNNDNNNNNNNDNNNNNNDNNNNDNNNNKNYYYYGNNNNNNNNNDNDNNNNNNDNNNNNKNINYNYNDKNDNDQLHTATIFSPTNVPPIFVENTDSLISDTNSSLNSYETVSPAKYNLEITNLPWENINAHWSNQRSVKPIEFFTVWDLAGQSYFFCMHTLFLTPRAVYLLIIDLTMDLHAHVTQRKRNEGRLDRREIKGNITHLDVIQYWILTIYSVARSVATDLYECKSRIIVVFTKSDLVIDAEKIARAKFVTIYKSLSKKSNCISIIDPTFHIVSAKNRCAEDILCLKNSIRLNAEEISFNHPLPVRWLDFALQILSEPKTAIGKEDINIIASNTKCSEDYSRILQLFHGIGVFYYRNNLLLKSLQNFLAIIFHIVSPRNSLKLLKDIGPRKTCEKHNINSLRKHFANAEKFAIIHKDALNIIFSHNNMLKIKNEIVLLLEEFGILLRKFENTSSTEYYIPYLFTEDLSNIYISDIFDQIIYIYFPDNQIPTSFYFSLLSLCLTHCGITSKGRNSEPKLGFDCIKFIWSSEITCVIDFTKHEPFIKIVFQNLDFNLNDFRNSIISKFLFNLQKWIIQIQHQLNLSCKLAKIVLNCPCHSFERTLRPCVYFETYLKSSSSDSHFYCKINQLYYPWRTFGKLLPIKHIPDELGNTFLESYSDIISSKLNININSLLEIFFEEGLISDEELFVMLNPNVVEIEKKNLLIQNLPNKGKDWANKFFKLIITNNSIDLKLKNYFKQSLIEYFGNETIQGEELKFSRYLILNNPIGICLIVHIENYDDNSKRRGSHFDFLNLKQTFETMNFLIYSYEDLNYKEFRKILYNLCLMDHTYYDTFFCIIMSHGGENDNLLLKDLQYINKDFIIDLFTAEQCPSLAGKPKVFIFQSCRGSKHDSGIFISPDENKQTIYDSNTILAAHSSQASTDDNAAQISVIQTSINESENNTNIELTSTNLNNTSENIESNNNDNNNNNLTDNKQQYVQRPKISNYADFYIVHAATKGHVSYRYTTKGSLLISVLCSVFKSSRFHYHLVDMMVEVRRRVSQIDVNNNVQCPEANDTLTKQLYLV